MLKVGLEGSGITTTGEPGDYPTSSTPAPSFSRQTGTQAEYQGHVAESHRRPGRRAHFPNPCASRQDDTPIGRMITGQPGPQSNMSATEGRHEAN